ncbi:site-specific DNA-methyltransferase [Metamycoplasma hominis]|uniref:site-specific DNA-methyltransferase n=1 Tax=Metamycoplasma hominis TaxID=2098 RepID=UPI00280414DD|nr:site-specific DNA-methyltransferase [Metamycoplasma hominis]
MSEKDDVAASKFIYRDKFSRTGWLNMMNERLKMARQLLKEDGVIFVSIDDTEQAYLKVLMDEIFGEENFVCNFVWRKKNTGGGSDKSNIDNETEFIICYSKNKEKSNWNSQKIDIENFTLEDEFVKTRGKYYLTDLDRVSSKSSFQYIESLDYEIMAPDGTMFKNYRNILKPRSYCYTLGKELFEFYNSNRFIEIQQKTYKDGTKYWKAYRKVYEKVIVDRNKPYKIISRERGNNFSNLINEGNISTSTGKRVLISILNNKDFSFPKPIELIKYLINTHPNPDARVLDFFAGSGTTGHAVLDLNREDGGNRTFTLVTNNENNIGINVCYERLYRINNGKGSKGETDFDWIKKNEPYNQNLDVFEIKYYDTDVLTNNNELIKQDFKNMLNDFNLSNVNKINEQEILLNLTALKPVEGKDSNESN